MRYDPYRLSPEERRELFAVYFRAVSLLADYREAQAFFHDLLPTKELAMLARRLVIAHLLLKGVGYREIARGLSCSMDTASRVANWLERGGYVFRQVHERELELVKRRARQRQAQRYGSDPAERWPPEHLLPRLDLETSPAAKQEEGKHRSTEVE